MDKSVIVSLKDIVMNFDDEQVLKGINLDIHDKEFITLLGPSGCGKTTTLRIIGGFIEPHEGQVFFDGKLINKIPPYKRQVNTVFQKYALFPHLNVFENIAFGLRLKKTPEKEIKQRVLAMLELVNLKGYGAKKVDFLSGGQQQRVAAARALVTNPKLVMADEPTGALDSKNARMLLENFENLNRTYNATVLMVTHDGYAASYTNRVLFIRDGRIFTELRRGDDSRQAFFNRIMDVVAIMGGEVSDAL